MKVYTFLEKDKKVFLNKILSLDEKVDFFVLFLPATAYNDFKFFNFPDDEKIKYISVSTVAAMKDDYLCYGCFGGFGIKFEKSGEYEILVIDNLSNLPLKEAIDKVEKFMQNEVNHTYLLFSVSKNEYLNALLNKIFKEGAIQNVRLYGGVASSNLKNLDTYLSLNNRITDDGFVIIKLKNVISYNTLSFGFIPLGPTYKITKAKNNQIFEIDGMSAEYFLFNLLNNTGLKPADLDEYTTSEVLWEFPLLVIDEEKKYIKSIRTFKKFNTESKSLDFFGLIEEGSLIKLSTGDSEDILRDVEIRGKEFYDMLVYFNRKPDVIMNISCTARNYVLLSDSKESAEQELYAKYLSMFNLTGFLTFGEIGPDRFGKPGEFFNETSILVGLEEVNGL